MSGSVLVDVLLPFYVAYRLFEGVWRRGAGLGTESWTGEYDTVVACIPAPNAAQIEGCEELLSPRSARVLRRVGRGGPLLYVTLQR